MSILPGLPMRHSIWCQIRLNIGPQSAGISILETSFLQRETALANLKLEPQCRLLFQTLPVAGRAAVLQDCFALHDLQCATAIALFCVLFQPMLKLVSFLLDCLQHPRDDRIKWLSCLVEKLFSFASASHGHAYRLKKEWVNLEVQVPVNTLRYQEVQNLLRDNQDCNWFCSFLIENFFGWKVAQHDKILMESVWARHNCLAAVHDNGAEIIRCKIGSFLCTNSICSLAVQGNAQQIASTPPNQDSSMA